MLSLISGAITLSAGVVFLTEEPAFRGFTDLVTFGVLTVNIWFLWVWLYMVILSMNWKNERFTTVMRVYGAFVSGKYKQAVEGQTGVQKRLGRRKKKVEKSKIRVFKGSIVEKRRQSSYLGEFFGVIGREKEEVEGEGEDREEEYGRSLKYRKHFAYI